MSFTNLLYEYVEKDRSSERPVLLASEFNDSSLSISKLQFPLTEFGIGFNTIFIGKRGPHGPGGSHQFTVKSRKKSLLIKSITHQ